MSFNTECTHAPICPYCGASQDDWWDGCGKLDDGDSWEPECDTCGKEFKATISVSTTFDTEPLAERALSTPEAKGEQK